MSGVPIAPPVVHYPESDGAPLAETPTHLRAIVDLLGAFDQLFQDRDDVFVAADIFLYYEEGNPRAVRAPDVLVAKGVDKRADRGTFKTWVEGAVPCLIVEVTSAETRREDVGPKRDLYAQLGVAEYFLFDALGDYLTPPLQGFRLAGGRYEPIAPEADGSLFSRELGVRLSPAFRTVRVLDPAEGVPIRVGLDLAEGYREEKARADEEKTRADALAAEVERLRALVGRGGAGAAAGE